MNIGESVRTGCLEIYSHKMRSFLSFSAIAFGVAAILYTFASVHRMFEEQRIAWELAGPGRMEIRKEWRQKAKDKRGLSKGLTSGDAEAIRAALPELYMVSPRKEARENFQYGGFEQTMTITGITPDWRKRDWVYTLTGRLINERDVADAARVCLLMLPGGWSNEQEKPFWSRWDRDRPYDGFIKRRNMLGRTVRLKDQLFTVVGLLQNPPKDKDPRWFVGRGDEDTVLVPLTTLQRYLASSSGSEGPGLPDAIDEIQVDTGNADTVGSVKRRIEAILDARHRGEKDCKIEDFADLVRNILQEMRKHAVAVLSVGLVAILAGGVGIMNVTLATIFARIREIGIRRAIGATRSDILVQFVIEAMLLGLLGGIAGIALGMAGLTYLADEGKEQIRSLQAWHFLATLAISVGAGFIFSLYPAYQASKLDPVEALRYE